MKGKLNAEKAANIWRIAGLFFLAMLWIQDGGGEAGVILLAGLGVITLARWRFTLPSWTLLLDQAASILAFLYWPPAVFALAVPLFESMFKGKWMFALPALTFATFYGEITLPLAVVLVYAGLSGGLIRAWKVEAGKNLEEADRQRHDRYELEELKEELLLANIKAAQMAEITERNRLARQLHDDVGHELTASVLALQAFEHLWKENDPQAAEMFTQARERLDKGARYLRETVHNIKPVKELGAEGLREIAGGFTACPAQFQVYGDTSRVPVHLWSILYPCLKEALTNVVRHSKAEKVEIELVVSPYIVRLSVLNDGLTEPVRGRWGIGIRNLRQRARAAGGSISSTAESRGFQLVCVLPLDKETPGGEPV
ncbi:two-component sensor histidine kinase [Alteribacter lacisalsi]|uniref:histidine kinase n=1 Tax=Alteribacter lacisalsi TaxID=2045244 RepID=A0A2W0HTT0_9BACI|nr:histidine kinase [Alteribacter lacisalsi]PYZ97018.1 two-component sensor histidine kinase [Alteribacter lacisalsi]